MQRVVIVNHGKIIMDDTMNNLKYHYLNKKIIEVKTKESVNLEKEDGIAILKENENSLKIEIDSKKKNVTDVIKLIDSDNIIDINIKFNYIIKAISSSTL